VKAWDYPALLDAYAKAEHFARTESVPVVVHVIEVTQPQGHSTSGSHERYKNEERLAWEAEFDGLVKFKEWILNYSIEIEGKEEVLQPRKNWMPLMKKPKNSKSRTKNSLGKLSEAIKDLISSVLPLVENLKGQNAEVENYINQFNKLVSKAKKDVFHLVRRFYGDKRNKFC
jgi:TPP-dependent pyruvate/acetoin dehydrogenase alpha subunit